ncbi:hypothetical protein U3A58_12040 [Algoriphagus sp. C2-6-M1]|uniref:glycoside hydrolase family 19 protein n=1 Tax=Algoriphagus persicinus TaxID=3108754 RepID=UPI002B3A8874|nr:hypothetical protein [Algoriphagus sp. C2-6-M1]MEB2781124.1 hypothetical protein [Algoriphagus sp. C2-6-M1]
MEEVCFSYGDDEGEITCGGGYCDIPEFGIECFDIIAYEDPACSDQYNPGSGPGTYTGPTGPTPGGGSGSGSGGGGPTLLPDDCNTSKENLKSVFPNSEDNTLQSIADHINTHGETFGIDTPEKLQHFLAQAGHESTNYAGKEFGAFEENLNYRWAELGKEGNWENYFNPITTPNADSSKANPNDYKKSESSIYVNVEKLANLVYQRDYLGNTSSGDGYKYRGRGIFQLTGKANYQSFTQFYQNAYNSKLDFVANPDLISSNLELGVISALWFFNNNVQHKLTINSTTTVKDVTRLVNGGKNGLTHRQSIFNKTISFIICI